MGTKSVFFGSVALMRQNSLQRPGNETMKVKFTLEQATKAHWGSRGIALLSLTSELDGGGWSTPRPGRFTPAKTRYPLYSRVGRPLGRYGRMRKTSPPPGFDPRTVQPVASHYYRL